MVVRALLAGLVVAAGTVLAALMVVAGTVLDGLMVIDIAASPG